MSTSLWLRVILCCHRGTMDGCNAVCLCTCDVLQDSPGPLCLGILFGPFRGRLRAPSVSMWPEGRLDQDIGVIHRRGMSYTAFKIFGGRLSGFVKMVLKAFVGHGASSSVEGSAFERSSLPHFKLSTCVNFNSCGRRDACTICHVRITGVIMAAIGCVVHAAFVEGRERHFYVIGVDEDGVRGYEGFHFRVMRHVRLSSTFVLTRFDPLRR